MARVKTTFWTRSLDKLRGTFLHASPEPASRKAAKKAAAGTGDSATKQSSVSGGQADTTGASTARTDKAPKKKLPVQPWYRHRQRW